jgi:hypothetical protein
VTEDRTCVCFSYSTFWLSLLSFQKKLAATEDRACACFSYSTFWLSLLSFQKKLAVTEDRSCFSSLEFLYNLYTSDNLYVSHHNSNPHVSIYTLLGILEFYAQYTSSNYLLSIRLYKNSSIFVPERKILLEMSSGLR